MKQNEIIARLKAGERLINNALVSTTGDTRKDTITDRQIAAVIKKVTLTEETKGPLTIRRISE